MAFSASVQGIGTMTATVGDNGAFLATFNASMEPESALMASMAVMGPKGDTGDTGPQGPQGIQGVPGNAATISVGSTTTLAPGSPATVANSGSSSAAVFDFGIPEGVKGDKGDTGDTGPQGPQGPQGVPGVVSATAPITYDGPTQTVGIDQSGFLLKADNLSGLADASVARGNLGLGTMAVEAAADYAKKAVTNTFTASQVVEVTDTAAALRVTQLGTGEAFRVEDSTNPDSTPFVITNSGNVGIGTSSPQDKLDVVGSSFFTSSSASLFAAYITTTGNGGGLRIQNEGTGASLRVNDVASDTTPFIVDASGNVGVKTASPSTDFEVVGNAKATTLSIGSSAALTGISTDVENRAGLSTSVVPTIYGSVDAFRWAYLKRKASQWFGAGSVQSTGVGWGYTAGLSMYQNIVSGANTTGFTRLYSVIYPPDPVNRSTGDFFDNKIYFAQGLLLGNRTSHTGLVQLQRMGIANSPTAGVALPVDDTTGKWFGWKYVYGSSIKLQVYNGTTYQETDTGFTPTANTDSYVYIVCWIDGAGTAYIEITKNDGTTVTASRTGAPTGGAATVTSSSWVHQFSGVGTNTASFNAVATQQAFAFDW